MSCVLSACVAIHKYSGFLSKHMVEVIFFFPLEVRSFDLLWSIEHKSA